MNSLTRTFSILVALGCANCAVAGTGAVGSCTRTDGRCIELGRGHQEVEYPMNCISPSVYSVSRCPAENHVGRCVQTTTVSGVISEATVHYYFPETTGHAESDCLAVGFSLQSNRSVRFTAE